MIFRAVGRCGRAYRSLLVSRIGRRTACHAFLVSWLSAGGGSVCRRGAYSAWFVSVNRCGRRGGSSACLGEAGRVSVWIMWSVLFSVDCFGVSVYINTCAWMLFSPFFVSWHVLVVWAVLWFSAPIALVYAPINRFLRGMTGAISLSIFISSSLGCLLTCGLLLPGYHHIHIAPLLAPLLAPLPSTRMCGEAHGYDTADGWRRCRACLISLVRCHPSHEMMMRRRKRMRQRRDAIG